MMERGCGKWCLIGLVNCQGSPKLLGGSQSKSTKAVEFFASKTDRILQGGWPLGGADRAGNVTEQHLG